jgi:hypothetical protein
VSGDFLVAQAGLLFGVSLSNRDPFDIFFDKLGKSGRVL